MLDGLTSLVQSIPGPLIILINAVIIVVAIGCCVIPFVKMVRAFGSHKWGEGFKSLIAIIAILFFATVGVVGFIALSQSVAPSAAFIPQTNTIR